MLFILELCGPDVWPTQELFTFQNGGTFQVKVEEATNSFFSPSELQ